MSYGGEFRHEYRRSLQCKYCSTSFKFGISLEAHKMMCKFNPDRSAHPSDYHIYVLEIKRDIDGEIFYYVGKTSNIISRMSAHHSMSNRDRHKISVPNNRGELSNDVDYTVLSVKRIISVNGNNETAMEIERELSYRIAIEKDTTNILGGK